MNDEPLYLRSNAVLQPLVDRWYAWAHLIPPATAARNIAHRHLPIMESYIKSPHLHAAAVANPQMLGGPFIDYGGKRVDEISALREETIRARADLLDLSRALDELDEMLRNEGTGFSLEPAYAKVPPILQGYVELVYDLNNNPSYRLIEPLLYRSKYYDQGMQSFALSLLTQDDRPFILSTPRLDDPDGVTLSVPFAHPGVDELFRMATRPRTFTQLKDALGFSDALDEGVRALLTPEAPKPYVRHQGRGARWRYFGHACILVETETTTILTDPVLSYTYDSEISRYTYDDLPEMIDYVLITHNHQDHILFETLLRLRTRIRHIVVPRNGSGALQDPSLRLTLEAVGFTNVIELAEMQEIRTGSGAITALPFLGEHGDLDIQTKMAWHVSADGHTLVFAADSCNISPELYRHVRAATGPVDVLFVGMECDGAPVSWIYGPLFPSPLPRQKDHSRRLAGSNYERALDLVKTFDVKEAYVYAMGQEPWLNYIMSIKYTDASNPIIASNKLVEYCGQHGIPAERLFGEKEILL